MGTAPPIDPFVQPDGARAAGRRRSPWQYVFGVIVVGYAAVFVSVIWVGAGFRAHTATPTPVSVVLAYVNPTPTTRPPAQPTSTTVPPTAPPAPPTLTPPPPTPTPDPNVDFRVPLAASNTGMVQGQRVAVLNITDNASPATPSARPPSGFRFVTIEVLVENTGDAPVNLGRWQVHTNANTDIPASALTGFGDPLPAATSVASRSIVRGVIVFLIPTNGKIVWLQYLPNPAFKGALYFDIT